MASSSSTDAATSSVVERVQNFVSENKKAILLTAAAAAIGAAGVAYYASTSRPRPPLGDVEKGDGSDASSSSGKKKKSKSGKKKKSKKDDSGPILEERKPKVATVSEGTDDLDLELDAEELAALPEETRTKYAAAFKGKGNTAYTKRNFSEAADYYTKAINVTPKPEPVFYSNRAACYVNFNPPDHEKVVADCDEALKLDPNYVKALNRRAVGLEGLNRLEEALRDYTAATILDKFQNAATANAVERVLKEIATTQATELMKERRTKLPSHTFISAYFAAFRPRPELVLPVNPSQGDETLQMALGALGAANYPHALSLVNEAITQGISWDAGKAEAFNLRGTFKFLVGDIDGSKSDLQTAINIVPSSTQALVKIASVHMEQGDPAKAFECFDEAIKQNANDPDIYYHRGQVLFIMSEFSQAAENYLKSTELDDGFVFSHIQLAVAQYKSGETGESMKTFRRTLTAFPQRSEPQNYYGELLLDQGRFQEAVEKFERAIEIEKTKPSPNVLALVNKGLALFQWKQDVGAAEQCCAEALEIDPECEAAIATLAQLNLQQSKIKNAMEMFKKQAEIARTEPELINALTYQYATASQLEFLKNYPNMAAQLNALARGM
ncbi:ADP/ATP carrier receptor [Ephemerocybe angulata]|uniref:ADP/ATP carrier receptor n=1 Tax=Ephemerocybe angulata TaxID=980116 RepID=A0A8H6M933_9AGAR|nr:ADP/ATP carrier receptor [Tulosesus angulatus]